MADASERLLELRPVTFRYKKPNALGKKPIQYGLVAEEVANVFPELVVFNKDGQPETVAYHLLASLLLNEFQKEHRLIQEQREQLSTLYAQVAEVDLLKSQLADLQRLTSMLAAASGVDSAKLQQVSQGAVESDRTAVAAR